MKTTYFKKAICAGLAGLMLTLTACGDVNNGGNDEVKADNGDASAAGNGSTSVTSKGEAPAAKASIEPLSTAELGKPEGEPDEEFYTAYRNYTASLFANSCTESLKNGENAMVSPESVMMALGMTANGANGETLAQMENALGGIGIDKLNSSMLYLADKAQNSQEVKFNSANSVWVRDDESRIQMKQEFCDKVRSFYGADSFIAPFDDTTLSDINGWVNENTNGMIPAILDEIPTDAVAYLVNAIAFEGEWSAPYEKTQVHESDTFTNSKGEEETVSMLYSAEDIYFEDENTTGFMKYYKGNEYAFMALLPEEGTDIADYVGALDGEKLGDLWNTRKGGCVVFTCMPEFTADYDTELSKALEAMGMELPFGEGADFSNMAETDSGELYIDRVLHKTHIEVDRAGTKAAAATAVQMTDECDEEIADDFYTVYLNRPFVYAIVDTENGLPVFIGAVNTVG